MVTQNQNLSEDIKKLTEEELKSINELSTKLSDIVDKFGQVKIEKLNLQAQLSSLDELEKQFETEFYLLKEQELNLTKQLNQKYGEATINLVTGEVS